MLDAALQVNDGVAHAGRFRGLVRNGQSVSALELGALLVFGSLAALASTFIETPWKIPGQAIVQSVIPMALGLSLVPRRLGGSIMTIGSVATVAFLRVAGFGGVGTGALTSLFLTGPALDLALWGAQGGWRLYVRIVLAGAATNVVALLVRLMTKVWSGDLSGGRRLASWLPEAVWTYPLCGVVAGLIAAFAWFRWASHGPPEEARG